MKDKIYVFVIGLLLGAVIATGAFYVYTTTSNKCNCNNQNTNMNGGTPPEMPSGQNNQNGQPPEMSSDNSQNSTEQNSN